MSRYSKVRGIEAVVDKSREHYKTIGADDGFFVEKRTLNKVDYDWLIHRAKGSFDFEQALNELRSQALQIMRDGKGNIDPEMVMNTVEVAFGEAESND